MPKIQISPNVLEKLRDKHSVSPLEVEQCFANKVGTYLRDLREEHQTDPETLWFVADTNRGRTLKVVFMFCGGIVHIKSAYVADEVSSRIYSKHGK